MRLSTVLLLVAAFALAAAPRASAGAGGAAAVQATAMGGDGAGGSAASAPPGAAAAGEPQDLLKWGLAHADHAELRRQAEAVQRAGRDGGAEAEERRAAVAELLSAGEASSPAQHMAGALGVLRNASSGEGQLAAALGALQILVEPLDGANDLHSLGGIAPVVALLGDDTRPALQAGAAHVLGTAGSNHGAFTQQLIAAHPQVPLLLLQLLQAGESCGSGAGSGGSSGMGRDPASRKAASKALFALASLVRSSGAARATFHAAGGLAHLQQVLGGGPGHSALPLRRRALGLLTDLLHLDAAALDSAEAAAAAAPGEGAPPAPAPPLDYPAAVAACLQLLAAPDGAGGQQQQQQQQEGQAGQPAAEEDEEDMDLQEKALLALLTLLDRPGVGGKQATALARRSQGMLSGLADRLGARADAAGAAAAQAAAAAGGQGVGAEEEEDGGAGHGEYLQELAQLARSVVQRLQTGGSHDGSEL